MAHHEPPDAWTIGVMFFGGVFPFFCLFMIHWIYGKLSGKKFHEDP